MEWSEEEYQKDKFPKVDTNRGKTYRFEEVEHFIYLGTLFRRRPKIEEEIGARIMLGNKSVAGLQRILRNKNVSRQTKIKLYKTVIRPVVTYASERWTLNKAEQTRLEVWGRKIFGGKRTEGGWFRRTNEEIKSLYKEASIVSVIKAQILRWMGHIERMPGTRIPKMVMERTIGGKKRRGRPKTRWKSEVGEGLTTTGNCQVERKGKG
ncbi:uncharacterized protein LOC108904993 [Anoplophora glabripennis]|uniref:uncharacterized protein LOC108904993 n=1 Tax=Anoplophora glabripennis TaxID=217634 RepID=UPI000873E953|nr:uncharacterized protein LOC108904993 [Anoplophora glabripennis]